MGRKQSRCRQCNAPIVWFRSPFTVTPRKFDPAPVGSRHPLAGVKAFPVMGLNAYRPAHLVEIVQVRDHTSDTEAERQVADMPWHLLHQCPSVEDTPEPITAPASAPSSTDTQETHA